MKKRSIISTDLIKPLPHYQQQDDSDKEILHNNSQPFSWELDESVRKLLSSEDFVSIAKNVAVDHTRNNSNGKDKYGYKHNISNKQKNQIYEVPKQTLLDRTVKYPVHDHIDRIREAVQKNQIIIISGETGNNH